MNQDLNEVVKMKQLLANWKYLSKRQWFLILISSVIIFLSLGLVNHQSAVYKVTIAPAENSKGPVKIVVYGDRYEKYLSSGALRIPASGWNVKTLSDSTILTAIKEAIPLIIYSEDEPVEIGLLHYADAGVVHLVDGKNNSKLISLQSTLESVSAFTIGGTHSSVPQSVNSKERTSIFKLAGVFIFILAFLILIAQMQLRNFIISSMQAKNVNWCEVVLFALPLFVSSTMILLSFWPGNVAYDASLQWSQAVGRGNLYTPIGITATLFFRLFTYITTSPALVIIFQSLLSAIGVALILKELCYRGVPRWAAQTFALALAILPQYATFFTNLGKDALSAVGIIFFVWSLLFVSRNIETSRGNYFYLAVMIGAAVFSGVMRVNVLPAVAFTVLAMMALLFYKGSRKTALICGVLYFLATIYIPKVVLFFSDEQQTIRETASEYQRIKLKNENPSYVLFSNFYTYHIFSAAVHSGISLGVPNEELFYRIAPRSAWAKYDCHMVDTTLTSVSKEILLNKDEYKLFLKTHQQDLARVVLKIIINNPSILIDRQICISKFLWYVGYKQRPFQTTATLGYDNITNEFKSIAGDNKTLLPEKVRVGVQKYLWWTETPRNFWLFWKPALICYLGLFCVLFRLTVQRDSGLLLMLYLPLLLTLVLALVIPFPAYRYQYPATLLMSLLCSLAFSSVNKQPLKG